MNGGMLREFGSMRAPPILLVDFMHGGNGAVILRRKGFEAPGELKPYVQTLLDLQHVTLSEGMAVWLADLDGDLSTTDGGPLPATVKWSDESGWYAEFDPVLVISNFPATAL
jgi:hypothetical protein